MHEVRTSGTLRPKRLGAALRLAAACLLAAPLFHAARPAQAEGGGAAAGWLTGEDFELQMQLPTGIGWASNPLRQGLSNLARAHRIAVFLDRRVDPDQIVDFSSPLIPFWELVSRLAAHIDAGAGRVGPVIYIGPPDTARVLATVIAQRQRAVSRMPPAIRNRLQETRAIRWPQLATPRELVAQAAADASLEVLGIEQIPHDLWPAAELPPLDPVQQLGLLLAGFVRSFEFTGEGAIRLVPLPAEASIEETYALPAGRSVDVVQLRRMLPGAELSVARGTLRASATVEQHDAIRRLLSGRSVEGVEKRYSLEIQNQPLGPVAAGLARKLGLEVEFDPRLADRLETRISFKVSDATLDKLLDAMLEPVNLSYTVDRQVLRIAPGGGS